VFTITH